MIVPAPKVVTGVPGRTSGVFRQSFGAETITVDEADRNQTGCGRNRSVAGPSAPVAKASGTRRRAGADRWHGGGHERSADGERRVHLVFQPQYRRLSEIPEFAKLISVHPKGVTPQLLLTVLVCDVAAMNAVDARHRTRRNSPRALCGRPSDPQSARAKTRRQSTMKHGTRDGIQMRVNLLAAGLGEIRRADGHRESGRRGVAFTR